MHACLQWSRRLSRSAYPFNSMQTPRPNWCKLISRRAGSAALKPHHKCLCEVAERVLAGVKGADALQDGVHRVHEVIQRVCQRHRLTSAQVPHRKSPCSRLVQLLQGVPARKPFYIPLSTPLTTASCSKNPICYAGPPLSSHSPWLAEVPLVDPQLTEYQCACAAWKSRTPSQRL